MAKSVPKKSSGSVPKSVPKSKKSSKQVKKTSKPVAKKSSGKKTSKPVVKKSSGKKTSKPVVKKTSKPVAKKSSGKKTSKPVAKKASTAKKASKQSARDELKNVASKATKQVSSRKSSVRKMSAEALDYELLTVEQLKNLLRERQLTVGGVKSVLIARLVEAEKKQTKVAPQINASQSKVQAKPQAKAQSKVQAKPQAKAQSRVQAKVQEKKELEQIVTDYDEFTECDPACNDDKYCNVNTGVCEEPDESKFVLIHNGQKFMGTKAALKGLAGKLNIEGAGLHHYKPEQVIVETGTAKRVTDVSEIIEAAANVSAADEETRQLVSDIRKCLGIK